MTAQFQLSDDQVAFLQNKLYQCKEYWSRRKQDLKAGVKLPDHSFSHGISMNSTYNTIELLLGLCGMAIEYKTYRIYYYENKKYFDDK